MQLMSILLGCNNWAHQQAAVMFSAVMAMLLPFDLGLNRA